MKKIIETIFKVIAYIFFFLVYVLQCLWKLCQRLIKWLLPKVKEASDVAQQKIRQELDDLPQHIQQTKEIVQKKTAEIRANSESIANQKSQLIPSVASSNSTKGHTTLKKKHIWVAIAIIVVIAGVVNHSKKKSSNSFSSSSSYEQTTLPAESGGSPAGLYNNPGVAVDPNLYAPAPSFDEDAAEEARRQRQEEKIREAEEKAREAESEARIKAMERQHREEEQRMRRERAINSVGSYGLN